MFFDKHRHAGWHLLLTHNTCPIRARILVHNISRICQEQIDRPRCSNHIPEEMVLPGRASHLVPISVTGSLHFSQPVWQSLVGCSRSPFTCFSVKRNHLNSDRLELLVLNWWIRQVHCSILSTMSEVISGFLPNSEKATSCSSDAASNTFQYWWQLAFSI